MTPDDFFKTMSPGMRMDDCGGSLGTSQFLSAHGIQGDRYMNQGLYFQLDTVNDLWLSLTDEMKNQWILLDKQKEAFHSNGDQLVPELLGFMCYLKEAYPMIISFMPDRVEKLKKFRPDKVWIVNGMFSCQIGEIGLGGRLARTLDLMWARLPESEKLKWIPGQILNRNLQKYLLLPYLFNGHVLSSIVDVHGVILCFLMKVEQPQAIQLPWVGGNPP
jgi:hypothetical protein